MILVTGATGTVGRQLVNELITAGADVRALSRTPERAGLPSGVEVVAGDLAAQRPFRPHCRGSSGCSCFRAVRKGRGRTPT